MIEIKMNDQEKRRLAKAEVKMLVLFGSQAQGISAKASDIDVLVFGPNNKRAYDTVYEIMSEKINKLVDIDIVFAHEAPMELLNHASNYGQVIYAKRYEEFASFRENTMLSYSDFAPYRKMFQQATLKRI